MRRHLCASTARSAAANCFFGWRSETAARKTAILTLTWDRVDFETGVVHYPDPDRAVTKKRRADVPISTTLRPILEQAYRERRNDLVLWSKAEIWATVQSIADRANFGDRAAARQRGETIESRKPGPSPAEPGSARTSCATRPLPTWRAAACALDHREGARKHVGDGRAGLRETLAGRFTGGGEPDFGRRDQLRKNVRNAANCASNVVHIRLKKVRYEMMKSSNVISNNDQTYGTNCVGNGEVESSILSRSTTLLPTKRSNRGRSGIDQMLIVAPLLRLIAT